MKRNLESLFSSLDLLQTISNSINSSYKKTQLAKKELLHHLKTSVLRRNWPKLLAMTVSISTWTMMTT